MTSLIPAERAHGILSLVLPACSFTNGAVLVVDGGMTAKNDLEAGRYCEVRRGHCAAGEVHSICAAT